MNSSDRENQVDDLQASVKVAPGLLCLSVYSWEETTRQAQNMLQGRLLPADLPVIGDHLESAKKLMGKMMRLSIPRYCDPEWSERWCS